MSTDVPAEALRTLLSQQTTRVCHKHVGPVASVLSGPSSATIAIGRESVNGNAMSSRSVLPIGSVTKTFTALALADAVVPGRLGLDTPLAELIEETPIFPGGPQITLGHLASHTWGYEEHSSSPSASDWGALRGVDARVSCVHRAHRAARYASSRTGAC